MATTIESLELEISQNSSSAVKGIDALSASLTRLKNATKGGMGLASVSKQMSGLNAALRSIGTAGDKAEKLAKSLETLGNINISQNITTQLQNIGTALDSISSSASRAASEFENLNNKIQSLVPSITALTQSMSQIGENVAGGLENGISNEEGAIVDNTKNVFQRMVDGVKGVLGIHSPSTIFEEIGENIVAGFAAGTANFHEALNIEELSAAISQLRAATSGNTGLDSIARQMHNLDESVNALDPNTGEKIEKLARSLESLRRIESIKISSNLATQLRRLGETAATLGNYDYSGVRRLVNALVNLERIGDSSNLSALATQLRRILNVMSDLHKVDLRAFRTDVQQLILALTSLSHIAAPTNVLGFASALSRISSAAARMNVSNINKIRILATALNSLTRIGDASRLQSFITQLNRIPRLASSLNAVNWNVFRTQIQNLANSLEPLIRQLNRLPAALQVLNLNLRTTTRATEEGTRATKSYINIWAKFRMISNTLRTAVGFVSTWVNESNKYQEDLNLFTVALGNYAQEAQNYANQVSDLMGIDPADWMRNQGVFNTVIRGFGVVEDKAYLMSKNLTQLGYDISSFYNISTEAAFQKLQSGISGELEPLRRLGYDLSVARLQQEAYNLGIKKSVSQMTQAEKAQLRYYAILTQVTDAQGDMARTLNAPANQLRVFQAQITQLARALGNIFIPLLNTILPYLIAIVKVIRMIIDGIAQLVGFELTEVDYSGVTDTGAAVSDLGEDAEESQEKVEKLKKSVMGFDELNLLNGNDARDTSEELSKIGDIFSDIELPQYDFLNGLVEQRSDEIVSMIRSTFEKLDDIITPFLLVIGAILLATGANIPLGLGLIAIGAVKLGSEIIANWDAITGDFRGTIETLDKIVGTAFLVLGAILTFTGANVPLGIALLVEGALLLASGYAATWDWLPPEIQRIIGDIETIVGTAFLTLGAILTFTGANIPLGIALLVTGALLLATAIAERWDEITESITSIIGTIEEIVGTAFLVLGAILIFSGANIPLGIALLAAGAALLMEGIALMWDNMPEEIRGIIAEIGEIVGVAFLVLGAILTFTAANIPLGIALLVMGATALATSAVLNSDEVSNEITEIIGTIAGIVGTASLVLGAILTFSGVAIPLGIALLILGAGLLISEAVLDWGSMPAQVKDTINQILEIAIPGMLAIGLILVLTGVGAPLGVALIMGAIAGTVAAVAINWDEIPQIIQQKLDDIGKFFDDFLTGLGQWANDLWNWFDQSLGGLPSKVVDIARQIIDGFVKGITDYFGKVWDSLKGFADGVINGFKDFFGIHSPSTVMADLGENTVAGLEKGMDKQWESFDKSYEKHVDVMIDGMKKKLGINGSSGSSTVFENIGKSVIAGLSKGMSGLSEAFNKVFKALTTLISDFGKDMYKWGSEMMQNLVKGINTGLKSLQDKVVEAAGSIRSNLHFSQPDEGPLADFNTWMPDMMKQLASGIADNEKLVRREVNKLASDMNIQPTLQNNANLYGAQPAVASSNGDEAASGIASAVYNAILAAVGAQNGENEKETPIIINLGNEQIASFLVKQNRRAALISGGRA